MDNYIGKIEAEWVDRAVELPPDQRVYRVRLASGMECHAGYTTEYGWDGACVVAWLRIGGPSDAIPREAVQAAVDEIKRESDRYREKFNEINADRVTPEDVAAGPRNLYRGTWVGADGALEIIMDHTGVKPTEVTNA